VARLGTKPQRLHKSNMRGGLTTIAGSLFTLILVALCWRSAQAQVNLGPAQASEAVSLGNQACTSGGQCPSFTSSTAGGLSAGLSGAVATADASIVGSPIVSASALSEDGGEEVIANAEVTWSLEIVPNGKAGRPALVDGLYVPVSIFVSVKSDFKYISINPNASVLETDGAEVSMTISDALVFQFISLGLTETSCDNTLGAHCAGTETNWIPPSSLNSVVISAGCLMDFTIGTCSEEVDPTFSVAPAYAPYYNLVLSPNLTSTPVPEPSTWAMLIVGFGGLGYAGWRRGRGRRAAI
jgi:hypothetical protein